MNYWPMVKTPAILSYNIFNQHKGIIAFTTTKQSLLAHLPRFSVNSNPKYLNNRQELASILQINTSQLVFPKQTHSSNIFKIQDKPEHELHDVDALVTNVPGFCLCVQTADCVPIFLVDPIKKVIGVAHSGWRGTVKKIVSKCLGKMVIEYNCNPVVMMAVIGPSISPAIYEVGNDVASKVQMHLPSPEKLLQPKGDKKWYFDLWAANKNQLIESGLTLENIEISGKCTYSSPNNFFSARRDGADTGRMVSGIMLKN